ncbi:hypothetical protein [Armatimonas sp.]|uniref:hypothetical protein n=1 Tax=Armatimonas sp. TaxID=1872638 RepID=UPI00374D5CE0
MFLREVGDTALLGKLLQTMEARASAEDIDAFIGVLKAFGNRGLRTVFLTGFVEEIATDEAISIAALLVRMAERDPKPELRATLPHLRAGLLFPNAPLEFIGLRKRLKAALGEENLPIPATHTPDAESLPIPSVGEKQ